MSMDTLLAQRVAIEDLYDRQLEAIEQRDFIAYDATFTPDAVVDLTAIGERVFDYPDYRAWLEAMSESMVSAQRLRGGLRLTLDGTVATAKVPVACHVTFAGANGPLLTHTGVFYEDTLAFDAGAWRISHRVESISWSA